MKINEITYDEWLERLDNWLWHFTTTRLKSWRITNLRVWFKQGMRPEEAADKIRRYW